MKKHPTFFINKSAWPKDHPFASMKAMGARDCAWDDTYKFITLIQDTSQTKISLIKANLEITPFPLRTVVQYELRGTSSEGEVKVLGWLDLKPRSWNYAMGMLRKAATVVS